MLFIAEHEYGNGTCVQRDFDRRRLQRGFITLVHTESTQSILTVSCTQEAIMKFSVLLASAALLAVTGCSSMSVGGHAEGPRGHAPRISGFDYGMQPVSNPAGADERAHGWRYFSDPATYRAVVISPQGDYYLSLGQGLRWVAGAQTDI